MSAPEPLVLTEAPSPRQTLSGLVERVVFHNAENGFCVLRVKLADKREPATLVGECIRIAPGEVVRAEGSWQTNPSFGLQFRATSLVVVPPSTREGIEAYLGSGMIKGIGRGLAKKLVGAFGERVFEVIERQPHRLADVPGIGSGLAQRIVDAWQDQKAVRQIMLFLHSHGLSPLRAARIFEAYGDRKRSKRSAPIPTAWPRTSAASASHRPTSWAKDWVFRPIRRFASRPVCAMRWRKRSAKATAPSPGPSWPKPPHACSRSSVTAIEAILGAEIEAGRLIADQIGGSRLRVPALDPSGRARHRRALTRLQQGRPIWAIDHPERKVVEVERDLTLTLGEGQRAALHQALISKILIITGGPGTGKTTIVRAILQGLRRSAPRCCSRPPQGGLLAASARAPSARPRPCIGCSRRNPAAAFDAAPIVHSPAISWSSTKCRWSTSR